MTDDDKLALLDKTEENQWEMWSRWDCKDLSVIGDSPDFSLIESCQHIRAGLTRVTIEYGSPATSGVVLSLKGGLRKGPTS